MNYKTISVILLGFFIGTFSLNAQLAIGDTLTIHAVSFNDPSPEGWGAQYKQMVKFPRQQDQWAKIEMVQWLKCDSSTKADEYPCGEWDYIWNTFVKIPQADTFEIMNLGSFVTPYGKRLVMGGENGWLWTYDITDYAPILQGNLELVTGNNQELLDLKFHFIKGKPIRDVLAVENIYPYGDYKYWELADDSVLKAKKLVLNKEANTFKLKARISGHGHEGPRNCCEWDSKTHSYYINDWDHFRWNVWKDCGNNAIYPQGGTWPFDRAGWCPGTKVDEYEFELTPYVTPGDTINFDYNIEYYSSNGEKNGNFRMSHQIVSYGKPNFKNDASLEEIIAPNNNGQFSRINPICGQPIIMIKNTGIHNLKSCTIIYGFTDEEPNYYLWHGNLAFLEMEEIHLPSPDWSFTENSKFTVTLSYPNMIVDENTINNSLRVNYEKPVKLPSEFILHIETNNRGRAKENSWFISSNTGATYYSEEHLSDSTTYDIPINLEAGCYEFIFKDEKEDGISLHWWNYNSNPQDVGINGKIQILSTKGEVLHRFKSSFGQELLLNFMVYD